MPDTTTAGLITAIRKGLPAHYYDCGNIHNPIGRCDCSATADIEALIAAVEGSTVPDETAARR